MSEKKDCNCYRVTARYVPDEKTREIMLHWSFEKRASEEPAKGVATYDSDVEAIRKRLLVQGIRAMAKKHRLMRMPMEQLEAIFDVAAKTWTEEE